MGSDNIIRIVPSKSNKVGVIYSFLISKYGQALFSKLATGGVQPYISEEMLLDFPIPEFEVGLEIKINKLIEKSSQLKLESFESFEKAKKYFDDKLVNEEVSASIAIKKSKSIRKYQNRLDASFNILKKHYDDIISKNFKTSKAIGSYKHRIFIPNRGKRNYTTKGLKYLSTTDISSFNYTKINKFLSFRMKGIETLKVKQNWILIARSGQEILGDSFYVNESMNNLGVNEHALRLIVNREESSYIYAFLSSNFGKKYLRSGIFGSAILTINDDFLRTVLIPQLEEKEKAEITNLIERSNQSSHKAIELENEAIALVENEIEEWHK
ncbi:type I restriction-modification system S subunit [Algibacter lectus]|uniref:Type I restriction-modification system S subunit n=2 Tax=Algibacter lectus TaxID=221126 RepID=A0A090WVN3_9FLAO|nr:type I restriction-modification system S subunit [Algibacter lectus]